MLPQACNEVGTVGHGHDVAAAQGSEGLGNVGGNRLIGLEGRGRGSRRELRGVTEGGNSDWG